MDKIRPNALAIIKKNDLLLAAKGTDQTTGKIFYRLMGGGIEFGETSAETIKREFKEELNAAIINEKFLCVIENVFDFNSKKYHEITFLYEADLSENSLYEQQMIKVIDKKESCAEWISIDEIRKGNIIIYPEETIKYL